MPGGLTDLLWIAAAVLVYFLVNTFLAAAAIALLLRTGRWAGCWVPSTTMPRTGHPVHGAVTATLLGWKPWLVPLVFCDVHLHRSVLTRGYEIAATRTGKRACSTRSAGSCWRRRSWTGAPPADRAGVLMIDLDHFRRSTTTTATRW